MVLNLGLTFSATQNTLTLVTKFFSVCLLLSVQQSQQKASLISATQ